MRPRRTRRRHSEAPLKGSARRSSPEPTGRDLRTLAKGPELQPRDPGIDSRIADESAEAAIGAGDHVLLADDLRILLEALRHEPRMLDDVGEGVDHAGDQRLAVGQFGL